MRTRGWTSWGAAFFLLGRVACAGTPATILSDKPTPEAFEWRRENHNAFQKGESILYEIQYGILSAGFASLEIRSAESSDGRTALRIVSRARTNKGVDVFFKVRDLNESWMDAESLCSLRFHQKIREGGYRKETTTDYRQEAGRFFHLHKSKNGAEDRSEGEIPPYAQDPLSSLYYLRTQELQVGGEFTLDANSGGKNWPMKIYVRALEEVEVPAGKFRCYRVEPVLAGDGIFFNKGKLEVWLTADQRRIPVLLRSEAMIGSFNAAMTEYRDDGTPAEFLEKP